MSNVIKKLNVSGCFMIDLKTVLVDYCGITDTKLLKRIKTHSDVKRENIREVRYLPQACLTKEAVLRGEILVAVDNHGHKAPIENPQIEKTLSLIKR